jgi:hypothetical protein
MGAQEDYDAEERRAFDLYATAAIQSPTMHTVETAIAWVSKMVGERQRRYPRPLTPRTGP